MLTDRAQRVENHLRGEHLVRKTAGDDHVRTNEGVYTLLADVVGQVTLLEREHGVERRLRLLGHLAPSLHKGLILVLLSQLECIHHGVVPQSLHLDLITITRRHGLAVDHRVHPRYGETSRGSPNQTVLVDEDAAVDTLAVVLQDTLHGCAVALPDLLLAHMLLEALQRPEEPERSVHCLTSRSRAGEHALLHVAYERVEGSDAILLVVLLKRDARQRNEGLTTLLAVPGVTLDHLGALTAADHKLTSRVLEAADEVHLVRTAGDRLREELLDLLSRLHLVERSREDDALALLELGLEVAGREQILVAVVAASQILQVLEVVVPIRSGHKLGLRVGGLQVEPREVAVHAALHTVDGRVGVAISLHVCMRQRVLVAEGKEGTQAELRLRMSVNKRVADHQLRALVNPEHLLLQDYATDTIGDRRRGRVLKIGDVLMATGLVDTLETVQGQVERLVVLHDRLVERRKQDISAITLIDRGYNQSVVFTGVAADDRRAHVTADTVGCEHLALERIFQVTKRGFVES